MLLLTAAVSPLSGQSAEPGEKEWEYFDRDLELSNRDDLQLWCRSLGLDDSGNERELKSRLREYYGIPPTAPVSDSRTGEKGLEIIIESAERTEYLNWENLGEEIHLSGGVRLSVNDPETSRSYLITSDKLIFSRIEDSLTALGNVTYERKDKQGEAETFKGEVMTFQLEGWKGIIFQGVSSKSEKGEGKEMEFFFSGQEMYSAGFDRALLDKGMITSRDGPDPEYSIRASKIWLLGPEEWGLVHGLLYIGRIPLLYLPFYYKSGNDLLFNPVPGYADRRGTSIQTTTYLVGQKKAVNDSFFSAGLSSETPYELERRGLFLYKTEKSRQSSDEYLKLMVDWYSRLGGFAGVEGELSLGEASAELFAGLGYSRSIDGNNNVFFQGEGGEYLSRWNSTYQGALELPFRWGAEVKLKRQKLRLNFKYLTDPSFTADFMADRQENYDPLNWLLSDKGEEEEVRGSTVSSLGWEASWTANIRLPGDVPFIDSISLTRLKSSLRWDSKKDDDLYAADPYSPTAYFFYPRNLILPDLGVNMKGSLWEKRSDSQTGYSPSPGEWLLPHGDGPSKEKGEGRPEFAGELQGSRPILNRSDLAGRLNWSSTSTLLLQNDFDYAEWDRADQVSGSLDKGKVSMTNSSNLKLHLDFLDKLISYDHTVDYKINHRVFLVDEQDLSEAELKDQFKYGSQLWTQNINARVSPFQSDLFKKSYIRYQASADIFSRRFSALEDDDPHEEREDWKPVFDETWLTDSRDAWGTSKLTALLDYSPHSRFSVSLGGNTEIFTDDRETDSSLNGDLQWSLGVWKGSLSQKISYDGETWEKDPFSLTSSLNFLGGDVSTSGRLSYDWEESHFSKGSLSLNLYSFDASITAAYGDDYRWEKDGYLWVREDPLFQPTTFTMGVKDTWEVPPLWKNRITNKVTLSSSWKQDLVRVNNSVLNFSFSWNSTIHDFWDIKLSIVSQNRNMYLYFAPFREELALSGDYDLFDDLFKSFNFFNYEDRLASSFNLSSLKLDMLHNLGSWNVKLGYSGTPRRDGLEYKWKSEFSFYLLWDPIPSINMDINKDGDDLWTIKAGETEKDDS